MEVKENPDLNYYPISEELNTGIASPTNPQANISSVANDSSNIVDSANGSTVVGNSIQSANFSKGNSGWQLSSDGIFSALGAVISGAITAISGVIGGWTISSNSIYATTTGEIKTSATVGSGSNGVIMNKDGLKVYDDTLGIVVDLPSDGSAPSFVSGNAIDFKYMESFTAGEAITKGAPVCVGRGCTSSADDEDTEVLAKSAGVKSDDADTNFQASSSNLVVKSYLSPDPDEFTWLLVDFDFDTFSDVFTDCKVNFYTTSSNVDSAGPFIVTIYPITAAWDADTVTYNTVPTIGASIGTFNVENSDGLKYHETDITDFMVSYKTGTECYGFLLKGSQSNASDGYVNVRVETTSTPNIRGRRMILKDKVFEAKTSITAGASQEYRCYNFIGFAAEEGTADNSIKVITQGVVSGIVAANIETDSELVVGEDYYISNTTGEVVKYLDPASYAGRPVYKIGRAISTTALIIGTGQKTVMINETFAVQSDTDIFIPTYFPPVTIETQTTKHTGTDQQLYGVYINREQKTQRLGQDTIHDYLYYEDAAANVVVKEILAGGIVLTVNIDGNPAHMLGKITG